MRLSRATVLGMAGAILCSAAAMADGGGPYDRSYDRGLLWRVDVPRRAPSHIFATLHVADERVRDIPGPVQAALAQSKTLTVEVIVNRQEEALLGRLALLSGGRSLDKVLGSKLFARAVQAVSPLGLTGDDIRPLKPWYVAGLLGAHPDEAIRRSGGRLPLDAALARMAAFRGHRLFGLQSADEHFRRIEQIDEADQVKLLAHAVAPPGGNARHYERIMHHYMTGNLAALRAAMVDFRAGTDPDLRRIYLDRLVLARNRLMARRLNRRLGAGGAFVALGAAHMPGESGVLNLLAQHGFTLSRVY